MPKVKVTTPDGRQAVVTVPEGATREEIISFVRSQQPQSPTTADQPKPESFEARRGLKLPATHPGEGATVGDSLLFGWGNEALAKAQELMGRGSYKDNLQEMEQKKAQLRQDDPVKAAGASIVPALLSGGGISAAVRAPSFLSQLALSIGEGLAFGAGEAKPDERLKGAATGAALGAGGSLAIPAIGRTFTAATSPITQKLRGPVDQTEVAKKALGSFLRKIGKGPDELLEIPSHSTTDTVIDSLGPEARPLLRDVASHSDESAKIGRESEILSRNETIGERLGDRVGLNNKAVDANIEYKNQLSEEADQIGQKMNERIHATSGIPLKNQDKMLDFLELKANKGILKKAMDSMEARSTSPNPQYMEGAGVDGNAPMIDDALAKEIGTILRENVDAAKEGKVGFSLATDLKKQWDELIESGSSDEKLQSLRKQWATNKQKDRAYTEGVDKSTKWKESDVKSRLKKIKTPEELDALRRGYVTQMSDEPDTLLSKLGSEEELTKIKLLFGNSARELAERSGKTERGYQETYKSLQEGLTAYSKRKSQDVIEGTDLKSGIAKFMERFKNNRFYSLRGGGFFMGHELINILGSTQLSDEAVTSILKMISKSGGDADEFLRRFATEDLPDITKQEQMIEMMPQIRRSLQGAYASGSASLADMLAEEK